MKLTQATMAGIDLPLGQSERIVFDERLPGFGLRVRAGGTRTWVVQYRVGKKQRRETIGPVELIMAARAYAAAEHVLAQVRLGSDPQAMKKEQSARGAATLHALSERFLRYKEDQLKVNTFKQMRSHLTTHWSPLNIFSVNKITRSDVAAQLRNIAEKRGPFAANRARATLSSFFTWAMKEGLVEFNPVLGVDRQAMEQPRDRLLTDAEIATIWNGCGNDDYGSIVRLLILTAQNRDQVGGIAKSEVNLKTGAWIIPGARTRNRLAHEVFLSDLARNMLERAMLREGRERRDLIFGDGNSGRGFSAWSKAKLALDKRIEEATQLKPFWQVPPGAADVATCTGDQPAQDMVLIKPWSWRVCDIRRTVAARMGDIGVLPHVIAGVLNNLSGSRAGVAAANARPLDNEKRHALDAWAAHVQRLVFQRAAIA